MSRGYYFLHGGSFFYHIYALIQCFGLTKWISSKEYKFLFCSIIKTYKLQNCGAKIITLSQFQSVPGFKILMWRDGEKIV